MKIRKVECKSAIGKCGFPGGGWAINPYVGCGHGCVFCYARFMRRFTGHSEPWGTFVDVRTNIAQVLQKQLKSSKYKTGPIFIGTVTDPYQPLEKEYKLTRNVLGVLKGYQAPVSILTKSNLILRDLDLLKQFKEIDVSFTVATLNKKWKKLTEPHSSTTTQRLKAMKELVDAGITVFAMMGPFWPVFTDPEVLFSKFKEIGVSHVFTESFNVVGGNWTGVEEVLKKHYPRLLSQMRKVLFDRKSFNDFYQRAEKEIERLSKKYSLPVTIYFKPGHAGKFK